MNLPLKPGHTTTEFWGIVIAGLSLTGLSAFALLDAEWVAGSITILTILYNASRAKLKQTAAEADLEVIKMEMKIAELEARHDLTTQIIQPPAPKP